jgi:hypothetical protein
MKLFGRHQLLARLRLQIVDLAIQDKLSVSHGDFRPVKLEHLGEFSLKVKALQVPRLLDLVKHVFLVHKLVDLLLVSKHKQGTAEVIITIL